MENVRAGVFAVASKLYGLKFEKLDSVPTYHADVETFKITDADGSLLVCFIPIIIHVLVNVVVPG